MAVTEGKTDAASGFLASKRPASGGLRLLALDTCGPESTLALCWLRGDELATAASGALVPRTAASCLTPALDELFREAHLAPAELDAILVVDGPGSFTGIRIGVAAAKALAEAGSIPLFAISRLRVLASLHGVPAAALDAGRGEVFVGLYPEEQTGQDPAAHHRPGDAAERIVPGEELASAIQGRRLVVCEPKLAAALPFAELVTPPTAAAAARVALPTILAGHAIDPATLEGRYLRTDLYAKPA